MLQKLNLFWQYFITGFICILLSVLATVYVMDFLQQRDNRHTFANESAMVLQEIEQIGLEKFIAQYQNPKQNEHTYQNKNNDFPFEIQVSHTFSGKLNQVHQYGDNQFSVVYHSPTLGYVSIKDKPTHNHADEDETDAWFDLLEKMIWLSAIVLLLGFSFYLVTRQTQRHIARLVDVSKAISLGDFATPVPLDSPEPIKQMAKQLDTTRQNLKHLREKERTLAFAMPHELRTPVSKIRLALELSRDHKTVAEYETLVEDLDAYTDELEQLITDLLALAKSNDSVVLANLSLTDMLDDIANENRLLYPHKTLTIHNDVEHVQSGELQLKLILNNLFQNAFKYADHMITVTVSQTDSAVIIRIANDGTPIPDDMRKRIFDPFTRVDASRNRKTGGVGLGLALVKQAVQQLGGRVCLTDDNMTCFEVVLPSLRPPA